MRLPKDLITHIAAAIVANLEHKGMVAYSLPKEALIETVAETITADMLAEERLNEEVRKLLAAHEGDIAKGQMDYRKVFELTKQKLAKERGIVL